ncbi:MAG: DUF5723 family protein [bacterium]|nr:DUF5723 family protein [bacterium]
MIALLLLLLLFLPAGVQALEPETAGYAGVHNLGATSAVVLGWNPALLSADRGFRMSFELPSFGAALANNSFTSKYWNDHFARDQYWSEATKNDILRQTPRDGLGGDAELSVPALGFTYDRFATRIAVRSAGKVRVPDALTSVFLFGNDFNRSYDIGDLTAESMAMVDVGLGFGYRFEQERIPDLHFGAGFHYYRGLYLATVAEREGQLTFTDSDFSGSAMMHSVTAQRGDGVGFDLGSYAVLSKQWEIGLAFRQLGARIAWQVDENTLVTFYKDSVGIIADSLDDPDYVERSLHYSDSSYSGGGIETRLPAIIQMNARYTARPNWTVLGDVQIFTQETAWGKAGIQAGIASEYRVRSFLPLYAGLSAGGPWRVQLGVGAGLRFRNYELDLGGTWINGLFYGARGIGFGLSQRLKF